MPFSQPGLGLALGDSYDFRRLLQLPSSASEASAPLQFDAVFVTKSVSVDMHQTYRHFGDTSRPGG
jgi:hypothetical protein